MGVSTKCPRRHLAPLHARAHSANSKARTYIWSSSTARVVEFFSLNTTWAVDLQLARWTRIRRACCRTAMCGLLRLQLRINWNMMEMADLSLIICSQHDADSLAGPLTGKAEV